MEKTLVQVILISHCTYGNQKLNFHIYTNALRSSLTQDMRGYTQKKYL